jgi:hypothetical protein
MLFHNEHHFSEKVLKKVTRNLGAFSVTQESLLLGMPPPGGPGYNSKSRTAAFLVTSGKCQQPPVKDDGTSGR